MGKRYTYLVATLALVIAFTSCREYEVTLYDRMRPGMTIASHSLSTIAEATDLVSFAIAYDRVLEAESEDERCELYELYFSNYHLELVDENSHKLYNIYYDGSEAGFLVATDGKSLSDGGSWEVKTLSESAIYSISGTTEGYDVEITKFTSHDGLDATASLTYTKYTPATPDLLSLGIEGSIMETDKDVLVIDIELSKELRFVSNKGYIAGTVDVEYNNMRYGTVDKVRILLDDSNWHNIEYNGEYAMIQNGNSYYRTEQNSAE